MSSKLSCWPWYFLALSLNILNVNAQEKSAPGTQLTVDLHLAVGAAISRANYQKIPVEATLKELQKEVVGLENAVNSGRTTNSDVLAESLRISTSALTDLRPRLADQGSVEMVKFIVEDIRLKNAANEESYRLFGAAKPVPEVTVRINAIKDNQQQTGFGAILVPIAYGKDKAWVNGELKTIPTGAGIASQHTPNAMVKVLPGVYLVQVYKTKLLATQPMRVHFDTKEIDVNVP